MKRAYVPTLVVVSGLAAALLVGRSVPPDFQVGGAHAVPTGAISVPGGGGHRSP
jgi:hypothetical protein